MAEAEKENCAMRVTRAAKKRAATALAELRAATKKRVVLGELTNLPNVVVQEKPCSGEGTQREKKSSRIRRNVRKVPPTTTTPSKLNDSDQKLDDPQMAEPYVSDIYEYLRNLEVRGWSLFQNCVYELLS